MHSPLLADVLAEYLAARGIDNPSTVYQYKHAIKSLARELRITPTLADLDDDVLAFWSTRLLLLGISPTTIRERLGRILALWTWLFRQGRVRKLPPFIPQYRRVRRKAGAA